MRTERYRNYVEAMMQAKLHPHDEEKRIALIKASQNLSQQWQDSETNEEESHNDQVDPYMSEDLKDHFYCFENNKGAIGRQLLTLDELPQGTLASYERDVAAVTCVIPRGGKAPDKNTKEKETLRSSGQTNEPKLKQNIFDPQLIRRIQKSLATKTPQSKKQIDLKNVENFKEFRHFHCDFQNALKIFAFERHYPLENDYDRAEALEEYTFTMSRFKKEFDELVASGAAFGELNNLIFYYESLSGTIRTLCISITKKILAKVFSKEWANFFKIKTIFDEGDFGTDQTFLNKGDVIQVEISIRLLEPVKQQLDPEIIEILHNSFSKIVVPITQKDLFEIYKSKVNDIEANVQKIIERSIS